MTPLPPLQHSFCYSHPLSGWFSFGIRIEVEPELGGDHHLLAEGGEGFPREFFVDERTVDLGGVEERDAAFHGGPEKRCHFLLVLGRAVGKAHAAEAVGRNFQSALSKFARLHCCLLISDWLLRFEGCHVDAEAVLHIGLDQPLVGFVDLLDRDDFDVGSDIVLAAEAEHFLRLGNAADNRAGQIAAAHQQREGGDGHRLFRRADEGEGAVVLFHLIGVAGDDDLVGAEAKRVPLLVRRGREDDGVRPERVRELHSHVAQPAEANDADPLALRNTPAAQGRIGRDTRAQERCDTGKIEVGRDTQDEVLVNDDAAGVAAVGDRRGLVLVRRVEGERMVRAQVLEVGLALRAGAVRVDQAAHRNEAAKFVLRGRGPNFGDTADDLVAGDDRVDGGHDALPLVTDLMEVGVADAAEEYLDLHVAFGRIASRNCGGGQRRDITDSGVGFRLVHDLMLLLVGACWSILFVGDLFHPADVLAVGFFRNGNS